jgi:hypothetical protein
MARKATHHWVIVGDVLVAFTTPGALPDDRWEAMIHELATKPIIGYLGTSVGVVEVTSLQRKLGAETAKKRGIPSAIVTEEALVRGLVTAASWLGANIKSFTWSELRQAVQFLGTAKHNEEKVVRAVMTLKTTHYR